MDKRHNLLKNQRAAEPGLAIETRIAIRQILSRGLQVMRLLLAQITYSSSSEAPRIDIAVARLVQQEGWRRVAKDKSQRLDLAHIVPCAGDSRRGRLGLHRIKRIGSREPP